MSLRSWVRSKAIERVFPNTPYTLTMGRGAGRSGGGRGDGSTGRGKARSSSRNSATPTKRAGEVGACAALGNHIFTISSGNKARDGDTLCTTKEAMITYIGTDYGEDTSKEFSTGVLTVLAIPPRDPAIANRHAIRVAAHQSRLNAKIINLTAQQAAIDQAISANPTDRTALKERVEIEDALSKASFDLSEDIEVVLTMDEKAERSNVYRTHREDKQRLITNRGKVYMLTIGQCTQALKDKLKEDATWDTISDSTIPLGFLR